MRQTHLLSLLALFAVLSSCRDEPWRDAPAISDAQHRTTLAAWGDSLLAERTGYWLLLAGRWELEEGATRFGSDSSLPIALPRDHAPPLAGTFVRTGQLVRLEPAAPGLLRLEDGTPIDTPVAVQPRHPGIPRESRDILAGSVRVFLAEVQGIHMIFAWDTNHPAARSFRMPETFVPHTSWRVAARLERFRTPRTYRIGDVTGAARTVQAPGHLVFRRAGRTFRLLVFGDSSASMFLVPFGDSTNASASYGGGRYLMQPRPGPDGWTIIDFNRSENPPCAFSAFTTCVLAPRDNFLALAVTAGERRPHK